MNLDFLPIGDTPVQRICYVNIPQKCEKYYKIPLIESQLITQQCFRNQQIIVLPIQSLTTDQSILKNKISAKIAPAQANAAQHKHKANTQGHHLYCHPIIGAVRKQLIYFFIFKCIVMSVLVQRWLVGSIWVSCWFVSPGVFVFSSQLGHSFTSSCETPWQGALLLIYALDERGTTNVENGIPIIGYSLHFPKIENEVQVSYSATINEELDIEPMEGDDNSENE